LLKSSKALAYLQWRNYVTHEDVQKLCLNVFRHRILLSYDAKLNNITEDSFLINQLTKVTLE
jgi:MoxR-like ATPase